MHVAVRVKAGDPLASGHGALEVRRCVDIRLAAARAALRAWLLHPRSVAATAPPVLPPGGVLYCCLPLGIASRGATPEARL